MSKYTIADRGAVIEISDTGKPAVTLAVSRGGAHVMATHQMMANANMNTDLYLAGVVAGAAIKERELQVMIASQNGAITEAVRAAFDGPESVTVDSSDPVDPRSGQPLFDEAEDEA